MADRGRSGSNRLPPQLTSFIGREREVAEVKRLVLGNRLVTLTGAGGCGKTRLALQAAGELLDRFPDGVWMVDLAPLSNAAFVPNVIAAVLGFPEQPGRSLQDTLAESLRPRVLLLLLDNCEHVLSSCTNLAHALLRECADLRIMATSRAPLGVAGEIRWSVPPLSLPGPQRVPPGEDLTKYDAVRLFLDRAVAAQSTFAITDGNARTVAHLCGQLDGLPLAIEMAAAWVRVLTIEDILRRVSDQFYLLKSGDHAPLPRHQTMRTAIDWSYDLLSERERLLLSRLSVFSGGWTLAAAEAVCAEDRIATFEVLDLLTSLVDKSLVIAETQRGEARYRLLETVRRYAEDRLRVSEECEEISRRHLDYFLSCAEGIEPHLKGADQAVWLNRLGVEHDNLRDALTWSLASVPRKGLRLTCALGRYWLVRGHWTEGHGWLKEALERGAGEPTALRAKALNWAGWMATRQRDYTSARTLHQEALSVYRRLEDKRGTADSLSNLGNLSMHEADHTSARAFFEESLTIYRQLGDRQSIVAVLGGLGHEAWHQGDYVSARPVLEEAVALGKELGEARGVVFGLYSLGLVAFSQHNYAQAHSLYAEGLAGAKELGETHYALNLVEQIAALIVEEGEAVRAAGLLGAAESCRNDAGLLRAIAHQADYDRLVAAIHAAVPEETLAAAWAEGRMMTLQQTIECALAAAEPSRSVRKAPPKSTTAKRVGPLAPREQEVAVLIADGKTNREIAARLSITEGTVEAHVQHILNKLGFNTRVQIAGWVVARGLQTGSPLDG